MWKKSVIFPTTKGKGDKKGKVYGLQIKVIYVKAGINSKRFLLWSVFFMWLNPKEIKITLFLECYFVSGERVLRE